ncbi:recombinase family protein [Flexivirga caeni]|uniref:recombinase family protein n=1 Tax=Flexivirga caeni TaxID=2294115 RepID=UPI0013158560|nr:recombinase family protein [Flexivirga caeni]
MNAERQAVVGYARVSTDKQRHDLQMDALAKLHPVRVFTEKASTRKQRPEFEAMLDYVRAGDQVAV